MRLTRADNRVHTNWYLKPTFSGRILNFNSDHPFHQKIAMVYNLIDKCVLLSENKFHKQNINFAKNVLYLNNYPVHFVSKYVQKRIPQLRNRNSTYYQLKKSKNQKYARKFKVRIPFNNKNFDGIANVFKRYDFAPVRFLNNNLSSIIRRGKTPSNMYDRTNAVYRLPCTICPASYIGETKRALRLRLKNHSDDIRLKRLTKVVPKHFVNGHNIDWENVNILDVEKCWNRRRLSEMLHIRLEKNAINLNTDTERLHSVYVSCIQKLNSVNS